MNKQALTGVLLLLSVISCKDKKKEAPNKEKFFPVIGYIRSQVAHVDTSLYSIRKIIYIDSSRSDTTYIPREEFAEAARDFLTLPDIFKSEYQDRYTEKEEFDETIGRVHLLYIPVDDEEEIIKSQEVLIKPDPSGDKVTTIIINTGISTKDSLIEKRLLWIVDESFLVTTIRQLANQPEVTTTYKVIWKDNESDIE